MIAVEAQSALLILHRKALQESTTYWLERYERALDECTRNFARATPAVFQVRSALANAKKRIDDHDRLAPSVSFDAAFVEDTMGVHNADETAVVDILAWLRTTPSLSLAERELLLDLAAGEDAESLARRTGAKIASVRQKISRARAAARTAWEIDHLR